MPDFDQNLNPVLLNTNQELPSLDNPATPVPNLSRPGVHGLSGGREEDPIFGSGPIKSPMLPTISSGELYANRRYGMYSSGVLDLEDQKANAQSNWDKAANGILKGLNLAATTVAGSFGMLYGVAKWALPGGKFSDIYSNEVMKGLDTFNNEVDQTYLPNYYSNIEKDSAWYSTDNWFTANFLFDKLIKNAGFAVGAMVSGNIANAGLLRAGAAIGRGLGAAATTAEASQAFKLFTPLLRNTARAFSNAKNIEAAAILEKEISSIADITARTSKLGELALQTGRLSGLGDAGRRLAISAYSSAGEASFEALQTANSYREQLIEEYKEDHDGLEPSGQELEKIDAMANEVGNTAFIGNMALLGATEFTQLPYLLGSTYKNTKNAANRLVGATDEIALQGEKYVAKTSATKFGKLYDKVGGVTRYFFDPKEAAQEVGQYALQVGTQNYFKKGSDGKEADVWTDAFLYGFVGRDEKGRGVGAFTSKEGMESLVLGGITGGLMQARGKYQESAVKKSNTEQFLQSLNSAPSFRDAFKEKMVGINRGVVLQQQEQDAVINGDELEARDLHNDMMHNYLAPRIKFGRFDMIMDDMGELKRTAMTEAGLAILKEQGLANINDTSDQYIKRITTLENTAKYINGLYNSLNLRYSGETDENGNRKYSPYVIDKMVYAASKVANYDLRIPQLNADLIDSGIDTATILESIIKNNKPNREATSNALNQINELDVNSEVKDVLKTKLKDVIELSLRRKLFLEEFDDIKANPLNYEQIPEYRFGETEELDVPVTQTITTEKKVGKGKNRRTVKKKEDVEVKLEVGKEYSLAEPVRKEGSQLQLAPKITVLSQTLGGELEVRTPSGKVTFISPESFKQYRISEEDNTSQEMADVLDQAISTVLDKKKYEGVEKPTGDKLSFINSLDNQELIDDVEKEFNKQVKSILAERLAAQQRMQQLLKNKEAVEKQQASLEVSSGSVGTGNPEEDATKTEKESALKDAPILFISTTSESEGGEESEIDPEQSEPHIKRSRAFMNKAKLSKNRPNMRAILVTAKTQNSLGLSGLAQMSYKKPLDSSVSDIPGVDDINGGFIAAVFVTQEADGNYFIDENGNKLTKVGEQVDMNKVVFQTMPTTSLTNLRGKPRHRSGQKEQAEAYAKQWAVYRADLFKYAEGNYPIFNFLISRGRPKKESEKKNHVGGILVPEDKISGTPGLIQISTTGTIAHNGKAIKFPLGRPVLQFGDTLEFLNNTKLGEEKAKAVFQVIKAFADKIQKQSEAGAPIEFDVALAKYLQNVLFWNSKPGKTVGNQIFVDASTMQISIGDKKYNITDIARNEKDITSYLKDVFHNVNNKTLSSSDKFYEYYVDPKTGALEEREWRNYQSYLLSAKLPDGSARSVESTPLNTSVAAPSEGVPYSFVQKYATLDIALPAVQVEKKAEAAPAVPGEPAKIEKIGDYFVDNTTTNNITLKAPFNDVEFTAVLDGKGGVGVTVLRNDGIDELAKPENAERAALYIEALKEAGKYDAAADVKKNIKTFVELRISATLQDILAKQGTTTETKEAPPTSTPVVAAPVTPTAPTAASVSDKKPVINIYWGSPESSTNTKVLSNLAPRKFTYQGKEYGSVEHAYQTLKSGSFDQVTYDKYVKAGGYGTKIRGKAVQKGFDNLQLMRDLVVESFKQNPDQAALLLNYSDFTHTTNEVIDKAFLDGIRLAQKNAELAALEGAKPAEEKKEINTKNFRKPSEEDPYRRVSKAEEEKMSPEEIEIFKAWAKEKVPTIPYEILENTITTHDGEKAWGVFEQGVAKFYKSAARGTEYHEIGEGIWKAFLTPEQRQALLDEFKAKSGEFVDRASNKRIAYKDATDTQAKERILDDFADFRLGKLPAKSFGEKVLRFFKAIMEFFKNFVRKPSLKQQLFEAIEAGKMRERVLPDNIREDAPEYRKIPGLSEKKANETVDDMTARAAIYLFRGAKKLLYSPEKITGDEVFGYIKSRYASEDRLSEIGENAWNMLVKRTKEKLYTLGINFNEEDLVNINEEERDNRSYAPEPFSTDWKKSSPFPIKFTLATLIKMKAMNQEGQTFLNMPTPDYSSVTGYQLVNFNRVFATLLDKLSNTSDVRKVAEKLFNLASSDSDYVGFVRRIGGDVTNKTIPFENFNAYDWRLFINMMQTFTKQKPEALIEYISGTEVYTAPANVYTAVNKTKYGWLSGLKAMSQAEGSLIRYRDKKYVVDTEALLKMPISTPQEMSDMLAKIGIDFPVDVYLKLSDAQKNKFVKAISSLRSYFGKEKGILSVTGETLGVDGTLSRIAELYVNVTNPNQDNVYSGVDGKQISSYANNNYTSVFENEFNETNSVEELKSLRPELNDVFSKNSVVLGDGLFYDEKGEKVADRKMKVSYVQGTLDNSKAIPQGKLGVAYRFTQEINQNVQGNYYVLNPGDGSTSWSMNLGNIVSYEDFASGRAMKKIFKIFRGYLTDDVALALDWKNRSKLKNVGNKAKELRFFKDILSIKDEKGEETSEVLLEINQMIEENAPQQEIEDYINKNIDDINNAIAEFIESTVAETRNILINGKQVYALSENEYTYKGLDSDFARQQEINRFKMSNDTLNNLLTFANANYIINNIEFHKILFGDPYQFKITDKDGKVILDETKRIKSFLSPRLTTFDSPEFNTFLNDKYNTVGEIKLQPGDPGYHEHKDHVNTVTFEDVKIAGSLANLREVYGDVDMADASSWLMDTTFREVKFKNGQWDDNFEAWHQWQMAWTRQNLPSYKYANEALRKQDAETISKPAPRYAIEVLKPIVSGNKLNKPNFDLVLDKFSQMPIYYSMVKGTNLEKVYLKMMDEGVGYAIVESGRKVGIENSYKLYNNDGSFNNEPFNNNVQVPWKAYGIQVENSFESGKEQTRGSQITKLVSLDLFNNGEAKPEVVEKYNRNKRLLDMMHENAYTELLNRLGIEDLGENGFAMPDGKAISEALLFEMLRREMSENAKDSIETNEFGQFKIPFEASPSYVQIRNIMYSFIDKAIGSPKMNGAPHVQVSSVGFEKLGKDRNLVRKVDGKFVKLSKQKYEELSDAEKKSVFLTDDTLKFYTKEDPYCEIMLPHWFKVKIGRGRFKTDEDLLKYLNSSKEGQSILRGVAFRIPTQAISSAEVFRVKGFLPDYMGYTVVVPAEITKKSGSDFDIDKLNMYLKSVYVDKNGDIRLVKYLGSEEVTKDFFGKVFDEKLQVMKVKKAELFEAAQILIHGLDDPNGLVDRYSDLLDSVFEEFSNPSDYEAKVIGELNKLGDDQLQATLKEKFIKKMYKKALENEYYDSMEELLTLPENFDRLITPVDDAGLSNEAAELDRLRGYNESNIPNRLLDRNYMTSLRHAFLMAKKWVGIVATNITSHSQMQKAKVYLDTSRIDALPESEKKILGDGSVVLPHNKVMVDGREVLTLSSVNTADGTNQLISNRLSGYGTATVDVVKDPFLLKLIKSDLVVGTVMFLERIGAGVYTSKFIGQPIISEYLSMLDSIGAKGLFTKTNLDAVRSRFVTTDKLIENASIDVRLENLDNNIREYSEKGELSEAKNAEQHRILDEFLKYAKMAEYSFKLTQAINYDTTKFRSGDTLYRKERRTEIATESNIFAGIDDVLNETAVGYQAELLGYYNSAMGSVFKLDQDQFKVLVRDSVLKPFAQNDYLGNDDYERIANKVRAAFLDYIIETKTNIGKEIRSLLVDPQTSVAARVQLAKQKYPEIRILQELEPVASDRVEGATSLKLKVNDGSALSDNLYIDMMRELRDASPELNELYNDIVKVAILQGTYKSAISFKNIIPVEDYSKVVSPIISQLVSDESLDAFAQGSFQRNNFKDDSVMPLVQPKFFLASDFPAYQQVNSFGEFYADIYQYYSTLFPNIEEFDIKSTSRMILLLNERYNAFDVRNDFVKVPRVVTDRTTGESIDMKTGLTITAKDYAIRKKKGDLSLTDVYGYMKVKDAFGNPLTYVNNEGDTVHVYKLINLYGDGSRVVEHHTDFIGSSLDNGTVKVDVEIPNADLITYFEKKYRTKLDKPTKGPVVETYKNIKVVADSGITTQTGEPGAAQYNRKDGVIKINREFLQKKFEEKAWTKPRKQRDGSFATALPENAFTTYKQFENFVMEHEYQHSLLSEQQFKDMSEESVTVGQYEDEINRRALAELSKPTVIKIETPLPGVENIPNSGLTAEQGNQFIDLLQPQISKQAYVENKARTANMMFSFGLRWARNVPNSTEKSEQAKNLGQPRPNKKQIRSKEGATYGYYLTDQNNNPLPSIKELQPIIDFIQSKLGIDMSNYDAMLGNIYDDTSFIHQHRDTTESVTAEGYPVIVINLGADGHLEYDKNVKSTYASYEKSGQLNLTNGGIYAFGVDGVNRFTFHHRIGSGLESANPLKPITLPNGQVLRNYRITLTFRRASDLEPGMPVKPNVIPSTAPALASETIEREYTPENITSLKPNEVFVFGSNTEGRHGAGAALTAKQKFGAKQGQAEGLQGQSYAIITKDLAKGMRSIPLYGMDGDSIAEKVRDFVEFANSNPQLKFYVTKLGSKLAGYTVEEIKNIFDAVNKLYITQDIENYIPNNVVLPKEYEVRVTTAEKVVSGKSIFEARSNPLVYTTDQTIALQDVQNLIDKNEQGYYLLAGYAGTGKTTIAENIARYAQMNGRPVFIMAPTNKAAKVLNEKLKAAKVTNTEATTIHRAIYGEPDPITGEWIPKADVKNSVVIIDESSMISKEVMKDLLDNTQRNNILIFMGDSFQLEPVGEDSGLFRGNVAEVRDSRTELKEVRRQSLDSNVLKVATITRIDNKPYVPSESVEDFKIVTSKNEFVKDFKESVAKGENSVMIVATNNERVAMNNVARDAKYGADKGIIRDGDVMISVANSSDIPNSETFKINTVRDGLDKHQITFTFGDKRTTYDMHIVYFTDENNVERKMFLFPTLDRPSLYHAQILKAIRESNRSLFDNLDNGIDIISTKRGAKLNPSIVIGTYGYAITAHKSQGSQWDKVYVNQNYSAPSWNPARWYYTAITRSSKEVIVFPTGVSSRIPVAEMNKKINDATVNESTPKDEGKKDPFTC